MNYKIIGLLICGLLLISCSNNKTKNLKCTLNDTQILEIEHDDEKLLHLKETTTTKVKDVDSQLKANKEYSNIFKNVDGIDIKTTKVDNKTIKVILTVDFDKFDSKTIKDKVGENFNADNLLKLKKISIDDFKKEYLKDYTCK